MEVKAGYKQTDVGIIPEDWKVTPFSKVLRKEPSKLHQITTSQYQDVGDFPVVDQGKANIVAYSDRKDKVYNVDRDGVIIFGDHTCIIKLQRHDFIVGADGTQILKTNTDQSIAFHAYALMHRPVLPTGYNRHFKFIKEREFQCPPFTEQQAIANALSDVDALIASLDALIAKKRDLKQAAMQQLLTGKTRLQGFSGEWETKRLDDIAEIIMGQSPSSRHYNKKGAGLPLIQGNADLLNRQTIQRIFTTEITKRGFIGDIVMSVRAPVGEIAKASSEVCLGRGVCALRCNNDYLFHYMIFSESRWGHLSKGSTFDAVNGDDVRSFLIERPVDAAEQTAIAEIISDLDAELTELEQRRDKTIALKQGMMQELLTGRTRLI